MYARVSRWAESSWDATVLGVDSASPDASRGGAAEVSSLAALLLAYVVGMAALATLWPFDFRFRFPRWVLETSPSDVALNLGLLFPAGFLWRLARPKAILPSNLDVLGLGFLLSGLLEGLQMFLPRCASPTDILMNGLGAWAGAALYSRLDRSWVDRICLALPLTKVLYLTVPLIGLQAIAARGRYAAAGTLIPIAAFSASIAAEIYRKRAGAAPAASHFVLSFAALFNLAALPLWTRMPRQAVVLVPVTIAFAWLALRVAPKLPPGERRIEQIALRRALPSLGAFLVLIALPRFAGDLGELAGSAAGMYVLRDAAAFSVLGYVFSQLHGRGRFGPRAESRAVVLALVTTALFGAARSWELASELPELAMLVAAGTLGAAIHRAEVTVIRALRGLRSDRPSGQPTVTTTVTSV
jgi:glycopeptide antibiotics resistance protein